MTVRQRPLASTVVGGGRYSPGYSDPYESAAELATGNVLPFATIGVTPVAAASVPEGI